MTKHLGKQQLAEIVYQAFVKIWNTYCSCKEPLVFKDIKCWNISNHTTNCCNCNKIVREIDLLEDKPNE